MPAIWKGTISFGLVNIPVELGAAVRADHISFRMLDAETNSPVRYERVRASDGEPVPWKEIVKGYEYSKGKFIVLTDEDFKAAALESSKAIEICDFVAEDEIDPRFFDTPYFLVPGKGADRSYALLREAMRETGAVGIGKIIMRKHQHLAGIHVVGEALVLELMRFANEVVETTEYRFPEASEVRAQERSMAVQLVKSLSAPFDPEKYTDDYRANLMRIIKAKSKGKKVTLAAPEASKEDGKVLDLMAKLKASLKDDEGSGKKSRSKSASGSRRSRPKTKVATKRTRRRTA
ncbi:MAG: Ku protein [Gemmatimonadaceae bacterium]